MTARTKSSLLTFAYIFLTLAAMIVAERSAFAAGEVWEVRYYAGRLSIFDPKTKATYYEDAVLYQINDPYHGIISQEACVKDKGIPAYVVKTHMQVDGMNRLNVSDRSDFGPQSKLTGSGVVQNSPWNWNNNYRLSLNYAGSNKAKDHKRIEVAVKMAPEQMLVRRHVYSVDGRLKQDWHGRLPQITKEQFTNQAKALKCWDSMD